MNWTLQNSPTVYFEDSIRQLNEQAKEDDKLEEEEIVEIIRRLQFAEDNGIREQ